MPVSEEEFSKTPKNFEFSDLDRQVYPAPPNSEFTLDRAITEEHIAAQYNNFYEFSLDKARVWPLAQDFKIEPWEIEVKGQVEKDLKFDAADLLRRMPIEERVYRFRCVEAWSMVIPWVGFPMKKLIEWVKPLSSARYVRMVTFHRPARFEETGGGFYKLLPG